jgi:hypothetical protein
VVGAAGALGGIWAYKVLISPTIENGSGIKGVARIGANLGGDWCGVGARDSLVLVRLEYDASGYVAAFADGRTLVYEIRDMTPPGEPGKTWDVRFTLVPLEDPVARVTVSAKLDIYDPLFVLRSARPAPAWFNGEIQMMPGDYFRAEPVQVLQHAIDDATRRIPQTK